MECRNVINFSLKSFSIYYHFSHISSDVDSESDENEIDFVDDAENELGRLKESKDATQSMFNM